MSGHFSDITQRTSHRRSRTLVVETVRKLMTHNRPHSAVIDSSAMRNVEFNDL